MEVALASLGIVGSITAALVWLLKKLFEQNTVTLKHLIDALNNLSTVIDTFKSSQSDRDKENAKRNAQIVAHLGRQDEMLKEILENTNGKR